VLPIVNENDTVAVEEIRFGDNDTLGGLVALVADADLLVLLTDIDGFYTANPKLDPTAKRIAEVWEITPELREVAGGSGSLVGTGGMRSKLRAAEIAIHSGIDTVVTASSEPDVLRRILEREAIGTRFHAQHRWSNKKSWLAYGASTEGTVTIDTGAAKALIQEHKSLLLVGIVGVKGTFQEGAIVEVDEETGRPIGKGMVSFSSQDLLLLLERKKQGEKLHHYHEVIHRDALVIFVREENLV
jgi:glutamate 5-kinase